MMFMCDNYASIQSLHARVICTCVNKCKRIKT